MHPIFKSRSSFLLYLAAWIPQGIIFGLVLSVSGHLPWSASALLAAPLTAVLAFVCLSPWYTCRSLPLVTTPAWKLLANHVIAAMCAGAIAQITFRITVAALRSFFPGIEGRLASTVPAMEGMVFLVYLLSIALHYMLLAIESTRQAELLSRDAELKALKAQINPHFLFNSLNSISALATIDGIRAREMCIRLSDFLRNSLRLGERVSIPFGEELALTTTYLDVERVRFGDRLCILQDFDPGCALCEVPPLLVQPLVENAIKHGIATLAEGGEINMTGRMGNGQMRVVIENPYDPDAPSARKSGLGLINVRNRLHTRYGKAARMEIQTEGNRFRVALTLPFEGVPER